MSRARNARRLQRKQTHKMIQQQRTVRMDKPEKWVAVAVNHGNKTDKDGSTERFTTVIMRDEGSGNLKWWEVPGEWSVKQLNAMPELPDKVAPSPEPGAADAEVPD